jgi:hypothetical protein
MVKLKKNRAPRGKVKKSKATTLQKQTVSQNVKVNIYKPTRVPKEYKIKQLGRDGAGGAVPNIRELPSFSFHSTVQQPASVLYGERFGNPRTVNVSPFERLLAQEAVDDNRALEVARLRNSLESSKLKKIQAEPILAPRRSGETEEDQFMARATASMDDNRPPFRISSVDEQGTLGVSFRSRLPAEDIREARLKHLAPTTIERSLQQGEEEALTGQPAVRGESDRFRTEQPFGESPFGVPEEPVPLVVHTYKESPDRKRDQQLGEPEIPNRLTAYNAEHGTSGDVLEEQRGEVVPITQGQAEEYQPETPVRRGRGRPVQFVDSAHRRNREAVRAHRQRAKSTDK